MKTSIEVQKDAQKNPPVDPSVDGRNNDKETQIETSQFWKCWLFASVMKSKAMHLISDYVQGHERNVQRLEPVSHQGVFNHIYTHIDNLMKPPNHILDGIYLGSAINASCETTLDTCNIVHIINITEEIPCYFDQINYLHLNIRDTRDAFIGDAYEKAYEFLEDNVKKGENTLVHCYMGSSRSASLVCYYIMKKQNCSFEEAWDLLKQRRPHVNLNINFKEELVNKETFVPPSQNS